MKRKRCKASGCIPDLQSTSISDLPENCISHILSFTTPRDVCRLSATSSIFRAAAEFDYVWERMLPPDLPALLSRAIASPVTFSSKKELFFKLCSSPLLIDSGKMSFSLDKDSGKRCFMISAKELFIMSSEDPCSWDWISLPDSRFSEVAKLLYVWWLEIRGAIKVSELSPNTWYAAYFILKHGENSSGFGRKPAELVLSIGDDGTHISKSEAFIHPDKCCSNIPQPSYDDIPPLYDHLFGWLPDWPRGQKRLKKSDKQPPPSDLRPREENDDGWMEVEVGEFYTNGGEEGGEVHFSLMEMTGVAKQGLVVEGIEIRPKTRPLS